MACRGANSGDTVIRTLTTLEPAETFAKCHINHTRSQQADVPRSGVTRRSSALRREKTLDSLPKQLFLFFRRETGTTESKPVSHLLKIVFRP